MRESAVEKKLFKRVKELGGIAFKFVSPGHAGVPDRIVMLPRRHLFFVELKTENGVLSPLQMEVQNRIRSLGFEVRTLYGKQEVEGFLREIQSLALSTGRRRMDNPASQVRAVSGNGLGQNGDNIDSFVYALRHAPAAYGGWEPVPLPDGAVPRTNHRSASGGTDGVGRGSGEVGSSETPAVCEDIGPTAQALRDLERALERASANNLVEQFEAARARRRTEINNNVHYTARPLAEGEVPETVTFRRFTPLRNVRNVSITDPRWRPGCNDVCNQPGERSVVSGAVRGDENLAFRHSGDRRAVELQEPEGTALPVSAASASRNPPSDWINRYTEPERSDRPVEPDVPAGQGRETGKDTGMVQG